MKVSVKRAREIRRAIHGVLQDTRLDILPLFGKDSPIQANVDFKVAQAEHALVAKVMETLEGK